MIQFRFSLRSLLLMVALIAAACATLRYPSGWLASVWSLAILLILLFAVLASLLCSGPLRPFWIGFAVFGWGYFWLSLFPSTLFPDVARQLVTTKALVMAYWAAQPDGFTTGQLMDNPLNVNTVNTIWTNSGNPSLTLSPSGQLFTNITALNISGMTGPRPLSLEEYVRGGHALCALLIGWLGGVFGAMLRRRGETFPSGTTVAEPGHGA